MDIKIKKFKPTIEHITMYLEARRAKEEHALFNLSFFLQNQFNEEANTVLIADLTDMKFDNGGKGALIDLRGTDFSYSILKNVKFKGCDLSDSIFCDTELKHLFFENSTLKNVDFRGASLDTCEFSRDYADWAKLGMSQRLKGIKFSVTADMCKIYADIKSDEENRAEETKLILRTKNQLKEAYDKLSYKQLLLAKMGYKTNDANYDQLVEKLSLFNKGFFPESWHMIHKSLENIFSSINCVFDPVYIRGCSDEERNRPKEYVHLTREDVIKFLNLIKTTPDLSLNQFTAEYVWNQSKNLPSGTKIIADCSTKFEFGNSQSDLIDLSRLDFTNANISESCFAGANLKEANFTGADISRSSFESANLEGASFTRTKAHSTNLINCNLSQSSIKNSDFRYATLQYSYAENLQIANSNFSYTEIKRAIWDRVKILKSEFSFANLERISMIDSEVSLTNCHRVVLRNSNLQNSHIANCNLSESFMNEANLQAARIQNTNLSKIIAKEANFNKANLQGSTKLTESLLTRSRLKKIEAEKICFDRSNLSQVNAKSSNLQGASLNGIKAHDATFDQADLNRVIAKESDFSGSSFHYVSAVGIDLSSSNMQETYAYQANFTGSDFTKTDMRGSIMQESTFNGSMLFKADIRGTTLAKSSLENVNIDAAKADSTTNITDVVATNLKGLLNEDDQTVSLKDHQKVYDKHQKKQNDTSNNSTVDLNKYFDEPAADEIDSASFKVINQILISLSVKG